MYTDYYKSYLLTGPTYQESYSNNQQRYFYQEHVGFPWQILEKNQAIYFIYVLVDFKK